MDGSFCEPIHPDSEVFIGDDQGKDAFIGAFLEGGRTQASIALRG